MHSVVRFRLFSLIAFALRFYWRSYYEFICCCFVALSLRFSFCVMNRCLCASISLFADVRDPSCQSAIRKCSSVVCCCICHTWHSFRFAFEFYKIKTRHAVTNSTPNSFPTHLQEKEWVGESERERRAINGISTTFFSSFNSNHNTTQNKNRSELSKRIWPQRNLNEINDFRVSGTRIKLHKLASTFHLMDWCLLLANNKTKYDKNRRGSRPLRTHRI